MTAPHPWLATVTYRDGSHEQQRCTSREHAEAWRDARLHPSVTSHAVIHTHPTNSDISID